MGLSDSWIVYCLVGLLLAHMSHRENLPLTMKSCFYPLIGDRIFGWMGDLIDLLSVLTTLFGVCTSLGLGLVCTIEDKTFKFHAYQKFYILELVN